MNLPTQLTLLRILLTPVFVLFLFFDGSLSRIVSFTIFTVASLTDYYDGYTARKFGDISMGGRFLDPLADKILVSSGLICFSVIGYISAWMVLVIVIRDFLITGLRSYAVIKGMPIVTSMLAKTKTFCQFCAIYFIFIYHIFTGGKYDDTVWIGFRRIHETKFIYHMMFVITLFTIVSGFFYLMGNRSHIKQMARDICHIFAPSDV